MRGDINFLDSMKQGEKKRNSNATSAVVVVLVLIVIAVMIFFFVKLKTTYNQNAELIQQLEQDKNSSKYSRREKEYLKVKNQFNQYLAETSGKDAVGGKIEAVNKLSRAVFSAIYDSTYNGDLQEINISSFGFDSATNSITMGCVALGNGSDDDLMVAKEYIDSFENRLLEVYITNSLGEMVKILRNVPKGENVVVEETTDMNGYKVRGWRFTITAQLIDTSMMEEFA